MLELEQVLVKADTIKSPQTSFAKTSWRHLPHLRETLTTLRGKTMGVIKEGCNEAAVFLAPWPVRDCIISFSGTAGSAYLHLIVGRDFIINDQEQRWLALAIEKKLNHPVTLKTSTVPAHP
ncbi:MAG: hypothetical protein IPQ16_09120 [Geobacteraceae bacterium]|nr:hypothetical protein [Geobacteraceae bacterium]